ncbi:putative G-protein coupled receptor B0563.6 [Babylonia areolata]|uniref:putative G-protein coupled receptor B0563.6 n=1 Tax=Babylonia areolata TaxID=304850 RepID=UPI003FD31954
MTWAAADSDPSFAVYSDELSSPVTGYEFMPSMSSSPVTTMAAINISGQPTMDMDTETETPDEEIWEAVLSGLMKRICIPIIVSVGLLGNFLCFVTLVFTSLRNTSTCVYMAVIAVLDSIILVVVLGFLISEYLGSTVFYMRNDWACGIHYFLFYFAIHFDVLLLLAMTVDRFIVVRFPLKAPSWCTPKSAIKVITALGAVSFTLNFQILFNRRLILTKRVHDPLYCWYPDPGVKFFMLKIYTWIDASIYSFIPFLSLLTLNILIIRQLKQSSKFSKQFTERRDDTSASKNATKTQKGSQSAQSEVCSNGVNSSGDGGAASTGKAKANTNIIVMLLLVSFAFLVLTSPVMIVLLYQRYYWVANTQVEKERVRLTYAFVNNLMYSNHAINFLLYCVSGRRFRQELKQFLTRLFCRS